MLFDFRSGELIPVESVGPICASEAYWTSITDEDDVGNLHYVINIGPNDEPAFTALQDGVESPGDFYVNLHSSVNASGASRGQLAGMTTARQVFDQGIVSATFGEGVNLLLLRPEGVYCT